MAATIERLALGRALSPKLSTRRTCFVRPGLGIGDERTSKLAVRECMGEGFISCRPNCSSTSRRDGGRFFQAFWSRGRSSARGGRSSASASFPGRSRGGVLRVWGSSKGLSIQEGAVLVVKVEQDCWGGGTRPSWLGEGDCCWTSVNDVALVDSGGACSATGTAISAPPIHEVCQALGNGYDVPHVHAHLTPDHAALVRRPLQSDSVSSAPPSYFSAIEM